MQEPVVGADGRHEHPAEGDDVEHDDGRPDRLAPALPAEEGQAAGEELEQGAQSEEDDGGPAAADGPGRQHRRRQQQDRAAGSREGGRTQVSGPAPACSGCAWRLMGCAVRAGRSAARSLPYLSPVWLTTGPGAKIPAAIQRRPASRRDLRSAHFKGTRLRNSSSIPITTA